MTFALPFGSLASLRPPAACLLCGQRQRDGLICRDCAADLPAADSPRCPVCAALNGADVRCGRCLRRPPAFARTVAAFDYRFPLDALVRALKYGHRLALAPWLGAALAARLRAMRASDHAWSAIDCVLPMPMHAARLRERGFNQAAELARALASAAALPIALELAQRQRASAPQEGLDAGARRRNQRGAFAADGRTAGRHVLIVDDVMTTGASADALARALRRAGARDVSLAVVARADRGG